MIKAQWRIKQDSHREPWEIFWSSLGFGSAAYLFAQSLRRQDSHISHLSLIFMMPETEPFAHFLCQLFMGMFGGHGDQRTERVSTTFWIIYPASSASRPSAYCTQRAFSLTLHCTSAVGGHLTPRKASITCVVIHSAEHYFTVITGTEPNVIGAAGGNYFSHT